tara:strand:- start:45032 stop:47137 length:2106 start_codon:yes stop_codon:yes gene_type:complete
MKIKTTTFIKSKSHFSLLFITFLSFYGGFSQTKKDTTALSEVIVYSALIPKSIQNSAYAVTQISEKDIEFSDQTNLTPILNKVPGVYAQQGALNTNRVTIRGMGARSQFSTNRVKAYFEDIPLTNAEGETVFEDIDPETIQGVEIIKGPNSTSFGAGLGGVIHLKSHKQTQSPYVKTTTTLGSFGLWKQNASLHAGTSKSNIYVSYNHMQSDGFRENSDYNRNSLNIYGKTQLNEKNSLSFIAIYTRLKAFIPSSINESDFINRPEIAGGSWKDAQGFESYDKVIFGFNHRVEFSSNWSLSTTIFGNYKDAYEPRPFDILDDDSFSMGLRTKLNFSTQVLSLPTQWSFGSEIMTENYTFTLLENLYQSEPGSGSIEGDLFAKVNQERTYFNFFLEQNTTLTDKLFIEAGLSFNNTQYSLKDEFEHIENTSRQRFTFDNILSPRLGLSYKITPGKNLYASISKGFSIPAVAETLTPEGQINTDLKPEIGWNYEMGFKANWLKNTLYTEVVLYSTQITNLLVARRVAEDQFVGINAGESSHKGIEALIKYRATISNKLQLYPFFSASFNRFRFKDFVDGDNDFSGNKLTGAPSHQWKAGFDLQSDFGFQFYASLLSVGKIPLNDSNTLYSNPYHVTDIKMMYSFFIFKKLSTELFTGVNNLFNEKYAASILPNAVGFGGAAPRYFYPGNPINIYSGVKLQYLF